jgi:hypothetical protein
MRYTPFHRFAGPAEYLRASSGAVWVAFGIGPPWRVLGFAPPVFAPGLREVLADWRTVAAEVNLRVNTTEPWTIIRHDGAAPNDAARYAVAVVRHMPGKDTRGALAFWHGSDPSARARTGFIAGVCQVVDLRKAWFDGLDDIKDGRGMRRAPVFGMRP